MKIMLCILSVLIVAVYVNCEIPIELEPALEICQSESGIPDKEIKGRRNMNDPKMKCFHACLMKKVGNMVDGKMIPETTIKYAMEHIPNAGDSLSEQVTKCTIIANGQTNECEVAAAMHICILEKFGPLLDPQ